LPTLFSVFIKENWGFTYIRGIKTLEFWWRIARWAGVYMGKRHRPLVGDRVGADK
jgi:hypothetical protein